MDKRASPEVPPRLLSAWVREVPLCSWQRSMTRHIPGRSTENKRLGAQPWVEHLSQLPHPYLFQPRLRGNSQREDRKTVRGRERGEVLWIAVFWAWHGCQRNAQHCMWGRISPGPPPPRDFWMVSEGERIESHSFTVWPLIRWHAPVGDFTCSYGQVPTGFSRVYEYIQATTKPHKIIWGSALRIELEGGSRDWFHS